MRCNCNLHLGGCNCPKGVVKPARLPARLTSSMHDVIAALLGSPLKCVKRCYVAVLRCGAGVELNFDECFFAQVFEPHLGLFIHRTAG